MTVVGTSHLPIGMSSNLTTVGVVTVPLLPRAAMNVSWSCSPDLDVEVVKNKMHWACKFDLSKNNGN